MHSGPQACALTVMAHCLELSLLSTSTGHPLDEQPLGLGTWGLLCSCILICSLLWGETHKPAASVCAFIWNHPALRSLLCPPCQPCLPSTATNAILGVFLLEFLEAGAVPLEQVLIMYLAKASRKELTEGSRTAGACEGLQGFGWKQKEHSRWVREAATVFGSI